MVQQLSMFDAPQRVKEFEINDVVEVVVDPQEKDVETIFYLPKFAGMKGRIVKVIRRPSLQYEVDFNGKIASVYHSELEGTE